MVLKRLEAGFYGEKISSCGTISSGDGILILTTPYYVALKGNDFKSSYDPNYQNVLSAKNWCLTHNFVHQTPSLIWNMNVINEKFIIVSL